MVEEKERKNLNEPDAVIPDDGTPLISELMEGKFVGDKYVHDQDAEINSLDIPEEMMERLKALSQLVFCSRCGALGSIGLEHKKGNKTIAETQGRLALAKSVRMPCGSCRRLAKKKRKTQLGHYVTAIEAESVEAIVIPRSEIDPIARQAKDLDPLSRGAVIENRLQARIYEGYLNYLIPGNPAYGKKKILDQL